MSLFERAAITGIGETAHGRGLQQGSALSLQLQASLAAIADADPVGREVATASREAIDALMLAQSATMRPF